MRIKDRSRSLKSFKIVLLFLALLFVLVEALWLSGHRESDSSRLKSYFGMVPGGYSLKELTENNDLSFTYWVEVSYPAEQVTAFYENSFRDKGWIPVSPLDWGPQRAWTFGLRPDPQTRQLACSYSYQASWTNAPKNRLLQVTLVYYEPSGNNPCSAGPRGNELSVTVQERDYRP